MMADVDLSGTWTRRGVEEGVPPGSVDTWNVSEVGQWMRSSEIDGCREIASRLQREQIDGMALISYDSKREIKVDLEIPGGQAAHVFAAVAKLKGHKRAERDELYLDKTGRRKS